MSHNLPPILTAPRLAALPGVRHAFFTREGGVSTGIYASLNLGRGSRDDPAAVAENRRRAAACFGVEPEALAIAYQIHSADPLVVDQPWSGEAPRGDAVVTRTRGLICGALSADCAPVLMADADARVVAAAHAGWRGALAGIVETAVETMVGRSAARERIAAAVGPCIGPESYEVGLDFLKTVLARAPEAEPLFSPGERPDKRMFDLPAFVLQRLSLAGVANAEWIGRDTCAEEAAFFSNRRAVKRGEGDYGRLLSAIMLE